MTWPAPDVPPPGPQQSGPPQGSPYSPYGPPYGAPYGPAAPARPASGSTPGWVWPLVVVTALVTGLVGGLLGGALVLGSSGGISSGGTLPGVEVEASPGGAQPAKGTVAGVAAQVLPSTVQIRVDTPGAGGATGSGFVIDRRGHVITNNHVVEDAEGSGSIAVVDVNGRRYPAEVVGRSPVYDVAVLLVRTGREIPPVRFGSSRAMEVGETVVAIGSPLGLTSTVTAGIVSALDRPVTTGPSDASSFINAVQTDAAINPGNSGGPLVNLSGQVVGVNSAIATTGGAGREGGNIGVGFAIPMEQVRFTAQQILDTGRAEYPVIGANVDTGESGNGAEVVEVPEDTPAAKAGLRPGDRIIAVGDTRVGDGISLIVAIRSRRPGETVTLTLVRGGDERTVRITLDAKVG